MRVCTRARARDHSLKLKKWLCIIPIPFSFYSLIIYIYNWCAPRTHTVGFKWMNTTRAWFVRESLRAIHNHTEYIHFNLTFKLMLSKVIKMKWKITCNATSYHAPYIMRACARVYNGRATTIWLSFSCGQLPVLCVIVAVISVVIIISREFKSLLIPFYCRLYWTRL